MSLTINIYHSGENGNAQMLLEATNLGLGNIWVRLFDIAKVQKEFNFPSNVVPICLMPLGYASDDYKESPFHNQRKELSKTTTYL